jgi:hypothetical protein
MNDLDDWLSRASAATRPDGHDRATDSLVRRLSQEASLRNGPVSESSAGHSHARRSRRCLPAEE